MSVEVRCARYRKNIVEQDHRAIRRRCASMLPSKTLRSAAITLAGVEVAHRIRKRTQVRAIGRRRKYWRQESPLRQIGAAFVCCDF